MLLKVLFRRDTSLDASLISSGFLASRCVRILRRMRLACSGEGSDDFDLEGDGGVAALGEGGDLDGGAGGLVGAGGEVLGPDAVEGGEVAFHVGEEDEDVDDAVPGGAGLVEDGLDVGEAGADLGFDVVGDDRAGGVELDAGDVLGAADAGADAGEDEEVADAASVWVGADGFGGSGH